MLYEYVRPSALNWRLACQRLVLCYRDVVGTLVINVRVFELASFSSWRGLGCVAPFSHRNPTDPLEI